jgi:mannose-6-phosphate isomerase-like protein (cupin superfamily)
MNRENETIAVDDIAEAVELYRSTGYQLEMIAPADRPTLARLFRDGVYVVLTSDPIESHQPPAGEWVIGRAGMMYRDLIPNRLDGRVIASHIRLGRGGPVSDYVHYHKIGFQMIYCLVGRIQVVYEHQGQPFCLESGDCVLQPPEMRHRVLSATAGAEVIEIGSPAYHETWTDNLMELPSATIDTSREYGGQRFIRHICGEAVWEQITESVTLRDLGISDGTKGLASARVLRIGSGGKHTFNDAARSTFCFVTAGHIVTAGDALKAGRSFVISACQSAAVQAVTETEILEVNL